MNGETTDRPPLVLFRHIGSSGSHAISVREKYHHAADPTPTRASKKSTEPYMHGVHGDDREQQLAWLELSKQGVNVASTKG